MVATDRVNFLFADARSLYDDAIEMLDQGKIRNAAEKAWGALDPAFDILQGQYHTRAGSCTSTASTTGTANRSRRWPT